MTNLKILKSKSAQAELITTVLLILISIAAVVLVSTFVINMVRENLRGTECFQTTGQLSINVEDGHTYYNETVDGTVTTRYVYLSIERGTKDFNMSGFSVIFGNDFTTKKIQLMGGTSDSTIAFYNSSALWDNVRVLELPMPGEMKAYRLNITSYGISGVNKIAVSPMIVKGPECEKVDEKTIPTK